MNERIIALSFFAVAALILFFDFLISTILLIVGGLLIAYWLYDDAEHRARVEVSLSYLTRRVSELSGQLEKKELKDAKKEESLWTEESASLAKAIIQKYSKTHRNPEFLLERKINIIMKSGKSREEALAKLYDEEIGSANTSGDNSSNNV